MLLLTDGVLHPIRWNPPNKANTHRPRRVRGLPQSGGTLLMGADPHRRRKHAGTRARKRHDGRQKHTPQPAPIGGARAPVPPTPPSTMPATNPDQHVLSILQVGSHQLQYRLSRTNTPKSRHKTNMFCPTTLNAKGSIISAGECARYAEGPTFRSTPQRIPSTQCSCSQMTPLECFVGMRRTRVARAVFPCDDTYCRG